MERDRDQKYLLPKNVRNEKSFEDEEFLNISSDNLEKETCFDDKKWIMQNIHFDKEPRRREIILKEKESNMESNRNRNMDYDSSLLSKSPYSSSVCSGERNPVEWCDTDDFLTYLTILKAENYNRLSEIVDHRYFARVDQLEHQQQHELERWQKQHHEENDQESMFPASQSSKAIYNMKKEQTIEKERIQDLMGWKEFWSQESPSRAPSEGNFPDDEEEEDALEEIPSTFYTPTLQPETYLSQNFTFQDPDVYVSFFENLYDAVTFDARDEYRHKKDEEQKELEQEAFLMAVDKKYRQRMLNGPRYPVYGSMETRQMSRPPTTSYLKLQQELLEANHEMNHIIQSRFKAKPIPSHVLIPRFTQEEFSRTLKHKKSIEERKQLLLNEIKPFSLHTQQRILKRQEEKSLQALKSSMSKSSTQRSRGEKVSRVAKQALEITKIKIQNQLDNEKKQGLTKEHTFQPILKKEIPDFEMLHSKFRNSLRFYPDFDPTHDAKLHSKRSFTNAQPKASTVVVSPPVVTGDLLRKNKPTYIQETKASRLKAEFIQRHAKDIEKQNEKESDELKETKKVNKPLQNRIRSKLNKDIRQEQQQKKQKDYQSFAKAHSKDYQKALLEIQHKVVHRPLLLERVSMDQTSHQVKHQFEKILQKHGVLLD